MPPSDNKALHRFLVDIAALAVRSFYSKVHIIGEENVPHIEEGPLIVVATHHNMMIDPSILSSYFPLRRCLNYWVKSSLFKNPVLGWVLTNAGNVSVDRTSKDNQVLFKGTFETLGRGEAMAIFPEGTSYTEPRIMQVKDGASWVALEYMKWAEKNDEVAYKSVRILPVAIVYTNKSKYRSEVIVEFTEPISVDKYCEQFLKGDESVRRSLAKTISQQIEKQLCEATINAPDWDTLYTARMARDLLWEKDKSINLNEFVNISQTLVDLFSNPHVTRNYKKLRSCLLEYYSLLHSTRLTNSVLSHLPLSPSLDPSRPVALPSRLYTLSLLVRDSLSCLIRLPFFLFPLIVHLPAYAVSRVGAQLAEDEEETQAQNKIVLSLLILGLVVYPAIFIFLWALSRYTAIGALLAAITVYAFANYHTTVIDDNYEHAKRLLAAWRVLVGVWVPRHWDLSMPALTQYTIPPPPPENQWVKKNKTPRTTSPSTPIPSFPSSDNIAGQDCLSSLDAKIASGSTESNGSPSTPRKRPPRAPSRRLIRHVLRARTKAALELASFFAQLEKSASSKKVYASPHLAERYGGGLGPITSHVDSGESSASSASTPSKSRGNGDDISLGLGLNLDAEASNGGITVDSDIYQRTAGWRYAWEVVAYLREKGAKITALSGDDMDWGAFGSDGEGDSPVLSDTTIGREGAVWIPPSQ